MSIARIETIAYVGVLASFIAMSMFDVERAVLWLAGGAATLVGALLGTYVADLIRRFS